VIHFAQHVNNSVDDRFQPGEVLLTAGAPQWITLALHSRSAGGCTRTEHAGGVVDLGQSTLCTASTDAMAMTNHYRYPSDGDHPMWRHAVDRAEPAGCVGLPWKDNDEHSGRGW
jgi:hypothetical protein